ncbi:glycosyltransferase [Tautonia rosea]|uniref:glycosyltransferase n=1 Tax=Tautonia rosea TaxID=2728037 RepID=UPI001475457B
MPGLLSASGVVELLERTDLHVSPSRPYPLDRSVIEAMAAGAVVIAWESESVREVIKDGQSGFLVPMDEPEASAIIEPVREVIEPGRTGLVAPLFDAEAWGEQGLQVLAALEMDRPLRNGAGSGTVSTCVSRCCETCSSGRPRRGGDERSGTSPAEIERGAGRWRTSIRSERRVRCWRWW